MGDGFGFDPEILKRVWGEILPIASDNYDNAIERMTTAARDPLTDHALVAIDNAWVTAVNGSATAHMLQTMQQTLLATADAVKYAMDQYVTADSAAVDRLETARTNAAQDTVPHPVEGQP